MFYIAIAHTCQISDGHLDDAIAVDELIEEVAYTFVFQSSPATENIQRLGNSIFRLSMQSYCYNTMRVVSLTYFTLCLQLSWCMSQLVMTA